MPVPVEIKKAIRIFPKESKIEVEYRLTNFGDWDIVTRFGSAWEIEIHDPHLELNLNGQLLVSPKPDLEHRLIQNFGLRQKKLGFEMAFHLGRENLVWSFQKPHSIVILPLWDLDLPKQRSRRIHYELRLLEI